MIGNEHTFDFNKTSVGPLAIYPSKQARKGVLDGTNQVKPCSQTLPQFGLELGKTFYIRVKPALSGQLKSISDFESIVETEQCVNSIHGRCFSGENGTVIGHSWLVSPLLAPSSPSSLLASLVICFFVDLFSFRCPIRFIP